MCIWLKTRGRRPVQDERAGMLRIKGRDRPTRPQLVLGIVSNAGTAWCRESYMCIYIYIYILT